MFNYSFIIPHKNNPELLNRCVNSIPSREDIQIIVVDDNSDEGKKPVLPYRKGLEILHLDSMRSKGAGKARNVGLSSAEGKWLLFPDCDDYYKEGVIDILDQYIDSDKDVVYINFEYRDGKTYELLPRLPFAKYFDGYDGSQIMSEEVRLHHNVPWTKMINRNYVCNNNFCFEEVLIGNDILFSMLTGYFTNNIAVEKRPLYVYLRNANSITTKKLNNETSLCIITHIIKLNRLYYYFNHPEWRESSISVAYKIIKRVIKAGPSLAILLFKQSIRIFRDRYEWVVLFNDIVRKKDTY